MSTDGLVPPKAPAVAGAAQGLTRTMETVRARLNADTAVLLIIDATAKALEPVASAGLDRTRRASVRVPVGRGFAGTVAATRAPVVLDEVTELNVMNPVLRAHGLRSLAGIPLFDGDQLVGVLHVGSLTPRHFDDADLRELAVVGNEVVEALRERTIGTEHTAALVLQRSLIPPAPPPIEGLDIAARYVPAEGDLGGDWYDVFPLPGERIGIVMGDVVGHGLDAAVVMGRLRSALRAYALISDSPAEVLSLLDHKITHFEPGKLATVIYGVAEEPYDRFTFSTAGHWPPIVTTPSGAGRQLLVPQGLMLGVDPERSRRNFEVTLAPGSALCLFTDGLVETQRSARSDSVQAVQHLLGTVSQEESADLACSRILTQVIGNDVNTDDIALMVIRRMPQLFPQETA